MNDKATYDAKFEKLEGVIAGLKEQHRTLHSKAVPLGVIDEIDEDNLSIEVAAVAFDATDGSTGKKKVRRGIRGKKGQKS